MEVRAAEREKLKLAREEKRRKAEEQKLVRFPKLPVQALTTHDSH